VTDNGPNSFTYDWSNQSISLTASGLNEAHIYDGNMKRVKSLRNGKTIYSVYSTLTGSIVYKDEATDNIQTHYLSGGGANIRLKIMWLNIRILIIKDRPLQHPLQDDKSGPTYMQARYYDPIAGRFLSTDLAGYEGGVGLYVIVTVMV